MVAHGVFTLIVVLLLCVGTNQLNQAQAVLVLLQVLVLAPAVQVVRLKVYQVQVPVLLRDILVQAQPLVEVLKTLTVTTTEQVHITMSCQSIRTVIIIYLPHILEGILSGH